MTTFFPGNSARSANWMRTLEFAIWEHAQTSALRHDLSSSLKRSLWPDASIQLRAAARPSRSPVRMVFGHPARVQADFAFWFHTFIVALDMSA